MAGEALARFHRGLALKNRDISAAGKVFAIGPDEQRPERMLPGLAYSRPEIFD